MLDLLVVGGGMAGLSAGAWAARRGLRVALIELAPRVGGSAAFANYIWTAATYERLRVNVPGGDPELGRTLVAGFEAGMEWVRSLGTPTRDPISMLRFGLGVPTDVRAYIAACAGILGESAEVHTEAEAERLLVEDGAVVGARVRLNTGEVRDLRARATLLATGGYQQDRALTSELIHPQAAAVPRRSNAFSAGGGIRLGRAAGGVFGKARAGFYGHLVPYPVDLKDSGDFITLTMFYSEHGLLLNLAGDRFVDETVADHLSAERVLEQPGGRALLVADERVRRDWIVRPYVDGLVVGDKLAGTLRRGGHYAKAAGLPSVAEIARAWGYDGEAVVRSIESHNAGRPGLPRLYDQQPLDEPPYHLVEVWPAITFTHGGLLIDAEARVLDGAAKPVPGLYAAGADAGGLYSFSYAGGLAPALVFGLRAARAAVRAATMDG